MWYLLHLKISGVVGGKPFCFVVLPSKTVGLEPWMTSLVVDLSMLQRMLQWICLDSLQAKLRRLSASGSSRAWLLLGWDCQDSPGNKVSLPRSSTLVVEWCPMPWILWPRCLVSLEQDLMKKDKLHPWSTRSWMCLALRCPSLRSMSRRSVTRTTTSRSACNGQGLWQPGSQFTKVVASTPLWVTTYRPSWHSKTVMEHSCAFVMHAESGRPTLSSNVVETCSCSSVGPLRVKANGGRSKSCTCWNIFDGQKRLASQSSLARISSMVWSSSSMSWADTLTWRSWSRLWWWDWLAELHQPRMLSTKRELWRSRRCRAWRCNLRSRSTLWIVTTWAASSLHFTLVPAGAIWVIWQPASSMWFRQAVGLLGSSKEEAEFTKLLQVKKGRRCTCPSLRPFGAWQPNRGDCTSRLLLRKLECWAEEIRLALCAVEPDQMEHSLSEHSQALKGAPWWMTTWRSSRVRMPRPPRTALKPRPSYGLPGSEWTSTAGYYLATIPQKRIP